MKLTIAIPTYNRNEILLENLPLLLRQLTPECQVLIIDNASKIPVGETLRRILALYPQVQCRIVRNRANVGGGANVLRCFELCETDWLWILSDAYPPASGSIETIFSHIWKYPDSTFMNFCAAGLKRDKPQTSIGRREFIETIDHFGNVLMISTSVFHATTMLPYLEYGFHFIFTVAPHIAMLLMALSDDKICVFSPDAIVHRKVDVSNVWAWSMTHYPSILGLQDLPVAPEVRLRLHRVLATEVLSHLKTTALHFAFMALKHTDRQSACLAYDVFRFRVLYFDLSLLDWMKTWACRVLIRWPHITAFVYKVLRGRSLGDAGLPPRWG